MTKVKKNLHDLEEGLLLTGLQKTITTKPTITTTEKTRYTAQYYITLFHSRAWTCLIRSHDPYYNETAFKVAERAKLENLRE